MLRYFVILAIIFVLTYNPSSGTMDTFINGPTKATQQSAQCCSGTEYRATHPVQCESPYFQGVQFGNTELGCPTRLPHARNGAIV